MAKSIFLTDQQHKRITDAARKCGFRVCRGTKSQIALFVVTACDAFLKASWHWVCRDCKSVYPASGEGLHDSTNPSGLPLRLCVCGGIVDLILSSYDCGDIVRNSAA
jgi:hypothetical protein